MRDRNRIGFGLLDHTEKNTGFAIVASPSPLIFHAFGCTPNVPKAHETIAILADDQAIECFHGLEFTLGLNGHLPIPVLNPPTG